MLSFVASYLGIVNVSFNSSAVDGDAPVVMLEHNKHLLDSEGPTTYINRQLQQQVFKEALSPKGVRARFAQLKSMKEVLRKTSVLEIETPTKRSKDSDDEQMFVMSDDDLTHKETPRVKGSPLKVSSLMESLQIESNLGHDRTLDTLIEDKSPERKKISEDLKYINPWSAHLYNTKMAKIKNESDTLQKFLLLQDLTEGLKYPCILDLKMGSRQHGVNASEEKKMSQERKCDRSTSKKLGVRICGMQVL